MLLGTVISQMQDETVALDTLLALDDLVLLARVREAADAHSVALGEYVSDAIGRFINGADDEAWLALMTAIKAFHTARVKLLKGCQAAPHAFLGHYVQVRLGSR